MSSTARSCDSYVWSVSDVIGQGATGYVFKCRHKISGEPFAAKVFNSLAEKRPAEIKRREIDVLQKLDHENIVKLVGLEFEHGTKATVLIMELCELSLHNILEQPENALGFGERDFLNVIWDITNGMKYLRDANVVHRDVKPGNILRATKSMGGYIYKITDFGAARELRQREESFMSIYGTEEYLHPDIYEKAVMRRNVGKSFTANVDLWSLGVTFYHLATGELPFRPFGGRSNRDTMFKMITDKAVGVISGVQSHMNGVINYQSKLPERTRMSRGLKELITPVLQGLLETDPNHIISYDEFFDEIRNISEMKQFLVYSSPTSTLHRIYLPGEKTFDYLQDMIAKHTNISAPDQQLYHNERSFNPDRFMKSSKYPTMEVENPLILLNDNFKTSDQLPKKVVEKLPKPKSDKAAIEDDANLSKIYASYCNSNKRLAFEIEGCCKAMYKTQTTVDQELHSFIKDITIWCESMQSNMKQKNSFLESKRNLLHKVCSIPSSDRCVENPVIQDLDELFEGTTTDISDICKELYSLSKSDILKREWEKLIDSIECTSWMEAISAEVKSIEDIHERFQKDKFRTTRPTILDDLAHKAEKNKLLRCFNQIQQQLKELMEYRGKLHDALSSWISMWSSFKENLEKKKERLQTLWTQYSTQYQQSSTLLDEQCVTLLNKLQSQSNAPPSVSYSEEQRLMVMEMFTQMLARVESCEQIADEETESLRLLENMDTGFLSDRNGYN